MIRTYYDHVYYVVELSGSDRYLFHEVPEEMCTYLTSDVKILCANTTECNVISSLISEETADICCDYIKLIKVYDEI